MGRLIEWKLGNDNRAVQPGSPARRSRAAQRPSAILATRFNGGYLVNLVLAIVNPWCSLKKQSSTVGTVELCLVEVNLQTSQGVRWPQGLQSMMAFNIRQ